MIYGIGQPVRRKRDMRFITGQGQYTADIDLPKQLHLAVLRAPVAHGEIKNIGTALAEKAEGVITVITASDLIRDGVKDMPCKVKIASRDGTEMPKVEHPVLANQKMVFR